MAKSDRSLEEQLGAIDPFGRVSKRGLRTLASAVKTVEHDEGHQILGEGVRRWAST